MVRADFYFTSYALLRPVRVLALLPYGVRTQKTLKTIWALHCAMGSPDMFTSMPKIAECIDKYSVVLVAPELGNGHGLNSGPEPQADFLQELLAFIRQTLPVSERREDTMAAGISMGAFAAVRWALAQPEIFHSVAAVSGFFDVSLPLDKRIFTKRKQRMIAELSRARWTTGMLQDEQGRTLPEADIPALLQHACGAGPLPEMDIFCGDEDYLSLRQSEFFAAEYARMGLDATLNIAPGEHDIDYWNRVFPEAVDRLLRRRQSGEGHGRQEIS